MTARTVEHPALPGIPCDTVLCWVGSLEAVDRIVAVGLALCGGRGGTCHVVIGLDCPLRDERSAGRQQPLTPDMIARAERKLAALYGGGVRTMVLPGNPVTEVARYARRHRVDLLMMGEQALAVERAHGEQLLSCAPCTVLILAPPERAEQPRSDSTITRGEN